MGNGLSCRSSHSAAAAAPAPAPVSAGDGQEQQPPPQKKTVVLKVYFYCVNCTHKVRRKLYDVAGVEDVATDMQNNQVTVKGTMDAAALVAILYKKLSKRAEVISEQVEVEQSTEEKEADGGTGGGDFHQRVPSPPVYYGSTVVGGYGYPPYPPYPPYAVGYNQYYSNENPQGSCTNM